MATNGSDKCGNCGGDRGIHQYRTEQCPVGGVEAPIDRIQEWRTSTFQDIPFEPAERLAKDMTIREHFAAMAMQGICANSDAYNAYCDFTDVAEAAIHNADALIDALNQENR